MLQNRMTLKRSFLIYFLLGAFLTFGFAPFHFWPALFTFGALLHFLENKTPKQAAWIGWFFGLGHFTTSLYWITNALLVPPAPYKWALPLAVFALPSFIALFSAFACFLYKKINVKTILSPLSFTLCWFITEIMRSFFFTGFPWNLTGYVWELTVLQGAYPLTIWGLSFFTTLFGATAFTLYKCKYESGLYILPIIIIAVYGHITLQNNPTLFTEKQIRVVQPNIPQQDKWNRTMANKNLKKTLAITYNDLKEVDAIIWPEAATQYILSQQEQLRRDITSNLPENAFLITGAIENKNDEYTNSVLTLNNQGQILSQYNKHHLVPFGEYIPFQRYLPLEPIAKSFGEMTAGKKPATLKLANLPSFQPLICYEVIFPEITLAQSPELLVNVTNDAWYGDSTGPRQHLHIARARAIESGAPLIRAANTGISAVFDAYGRILAKIPLGQQGIIDIYIPKDRVK